MFMVPNRQNLTVYEVKTFGRDKKAIIHPKIWQQKLIDTNFL